MRDFKNILVPIDFAECSRAALQHALAFAGRLGASVEVMHAWFTPAYVSPSIAVSIGASNTEILEEIAVREAKSQMADFMEGVKKPAGVTLRTSIAYGVPAEVILERAKSFDLIIMGTHGRSGLNHLLMGSVTEKVLRTSPIPVLVVNRLAAKPAS
jgi:nucleotide-binding universal stress UspA family protein